MKMEANGDINPDHPVMKGLKRAMKKKEMNTTKQFTNTDKTVSELLAEAKEINARRAAVSKATSPIVDVFLCSADGVVELAKFAMSEAPILKAHGVIVVEADAVSMLTFKLQKQYHAGDVRLDAMLRSESFKQAYSKAK